MNRVSVSILEKEIRKWFENRGFNGVPCFPSWERNFKLSDGEQNVVLMGDFLAQLLDCRAWASGKNRIWVLSESNRRACVELAGFLNEEVGIVPRYDLFPKQKDPAHPPAEDQQWTLVYAGRVAQYKNFDFLLRTVSNLQTVYSQPVKLKVYGSFSRESWDRYTHKFVSYRRTVTELISQLPWVHEPEFFGRVSPEAWLNTNDPNKVFISLSQYLMEDFGVSAAQAQSRGWPLILSDWGGHRDIWGPNVIKVPPMLLGERYHSPAFCDGLARSTASFIVKQLEARKFHFKEEERKGLVFGTLPEAVDRSRLEEISQNLKAQVSRKIFSYPAGRDQFHKMDQKDRYFLNFYRECLGKFSARSRLEILLVLPPYKGKSGEIRKAVAPMESMFAELASFDEGVQVQPTRLDKGDFFETMSLLKARRLVVTYLTETFLRKLKEVRLLQKKQPPMMLYVHGLTDWKRRRVQRFIPYLTEDDLVVFCSERLRKEFQKEAPHLKTRTDVSAFSTNRKTARLRI